MKITFLYHSAFLVELTGCSLLFDWYGGPVPDFDRNKPLYVFISHHHGDHYAPEIFSLLGMDNVWYFSATCVRLSAKRKQALGIEESHLFRLSAGQTAAAGDVTVTTLRSTDAGVAFLVTCEGKTLFHAGDLQWWHWEEERESWNADMERDFKRECAKLQGRAVDVAFLVLDPRQEEAFWWGFDWWMRTMDVAAAFPMHSWEDFSLVRRLKALPVSEPYRDRVQEIRYPGQQFLLGESGEISSCENPFGVV